MENYTFNSFTLQLEGLKVTEVSMYPVFFFFFFSYIIILVANVGIVVLVFIDMSLHQPMYLLFCNLPVNDIIGNSIMVPRLLIDILRPPSERLISYYECVVQAFTTHMFGTTSHTVLMIMAFDRYVAICNPLRYAAIMSNRMVIKLTVSAWGVAFVLVGILLGLTVRLNRCRTMITNPFCDNASLFKLSCDSVFINNVYGLTFTVVLFTASIGSMVLTYTRIAVVCLTSKSKTVNSKALKTCSTHLFVYLLMFVCGMLIILLHRFPQYSDYRKLSAILFHIIPGSLNPIIYGVQSKEIRKFLSKLFQPRKGFCFVDMENQTFRQDFLILEGLKVTLQSFIPAFILLLLVYIFIMVCNIGLVVLTFRSRSLQQPMYLLLCNMSINDAFGATIIIPHILRDLLTPNSVRFIRYIDCAAQAFCVHLHASASHTVLMIMAFDRYVAICNPLRYATIMTNRMVVKLSAAAWGTALVLVLILVGLSVRLSRCRWIVFNPFCDNASLFKLSCESVLVNNIYGLGYTVVLLGSSIGSVTLTYLKIAAVCVLSKNKALNSRALQTCTTHLAVYVILLVSGFIIVILHRFPQLSDHRKVASVLGHVALPALNAVIYGLQIKEVRQRIVTLFHKDKVAVMEGK
ncbi:uncharacterized protein ABDE67_010560 [Symphorus nematophorus]